MTRSRDYGGAEGRQRKNALGGRRKPLKRFDPDKEIKVNSFAFLWPGLAGFGQDLAEFGIGLHSPWDQAGRIKAALVEAAVALWRSRLWISRKCC